MIRTMTKLLRNNGAERVSVTQNCTEGGYKLYKCANCDETEKRDVTSALGHAYENGVCTRCGEADPDYNPGGGNDDGGSSGNFLTDFFAKIASFFQRIINWFKGLFN